MTTYGERLEQALGVQIKIELVERDMLQRDLADAIGIERATLNRYMRGRTSMPMPVFYRIAAALSLSPVELMRRVEARIQGD